MGRLSNKSVRDQAAYNLLLDSGLRLVEVSRLLSSLPEAEKLEGFYRCPVGLFYMQLKRKADQYYPRYTQYLTELRRKAGK